MIIDVRSGAESDSMHIEGSYHVPLAIVDLQIAQVRGEAGGRADHDDDQGRSDGQSHRKSQDQGEGRDDQEAVRIGARIPDKALKRGFGILVLVVAAYVAVEALLS